MEKAFLGELPDEHLDYLEKTALRSVIIAVVARPTYETLVSMLSIQ
jgi:hypothetical protein